MTESSRRLQEGIGGAERDADRMAAVAGSTLLVVAELILLYLGGTDDNRTDILAAGALALGLAGFVTPITARLATGASLAAAISLGVLGLLVLVIACFKLPQMGFQSFMRLGGEMQHRRLYAIVLTVRTLLVLDLVVCCGFNLLFYLAFWHADGWVATSDSTIVSTIALGVSVLSTLLACIAAQRRASWPLLVLLLIGLGAAVTLYIAGASITQSPRVASIPCLARPYWLTMSIASLAVRGLAALLHVIICCKRLPRPGPPVVPEELASLSPQQKKALNKIAKGEVWTSS